MFKNETITQVLQNLSNILLFYSTMYTIFFLFTKDNALLITAADMPNEWNKNAITIMWLFYIKNFMLSAKIYSLFVRQFTISCHQNECLCRQLISISLYIGKFIRKVASQSFVSYFWFVHKTRHDKYWRHILFINIIMCVYTRPSRVCRYGINFINFKSSCV